MLFLLRKMAVIAAAAASASLIVSLFLRWRREGFCPDGEYCILILRPDTDYRTFTGWEAFAFVDVVTTGLALCCLLLITIGQAHRLAWLLSMFFGMAAFALLSIEFAFPSNDIANGPALAGAILAFLSAATIAASSFFMLVTPRNRA